MPRVDGIAGGMRISGRLSILVVEQFHQLFDQPDRCAVFAYTNTAPVLHPQSEDGSHAACTAHYKYSSPYCYTGRAYSTTAIELHHLQQRYHARAAGEWLTGRSLRSRAYLQ